MLSKMSKLVGIFRQLPFLEEFGTGKFGRGGGGTRDTGLVTVDNLFENPARYYAGISKLDSRKHFDGLSSSLESKRDQKR